MNVCILKCLVGVAHVLRVKQPPMHYTVNCSMLFKKCINYNVALLKHNVFEYQECLMMSTCGRYLFCRTQSKTLRN